jgi:hypothetical protein
MQKSKGAKGRFAKRTVHYKGEGIEVFSTSTGGLFVKDLRSFAVVRLNSDNMRRGLEIDTLGFRIEAFPFNGAVSWRVCPE